IDKVVPKLNKKWSRSQVQAWIEKKNLLVNGAFIKSNYKVKENDVIQVEIPPAKPFEMIAEHIPLTIVYEDAAIMIINKERGMVVHPGPSHPSGTLANALYYYKDLSHVNGVIR